MRFQKIISTILHPIVIPTIGVLLYFLFIPHRIQKSQQLALLSLIFVATYLVPLLVLILLKSFKSIKSFNVYSIKERKIPVLLMIVLFYVLGNALTKISVAKDFGILFYATVFSLIIVYLLFTIRFKTSLHMLSMGNAIGFFLVLGIRYTISVLPVIIGFILLSGLLASSRLHLKAHTVKEIYTGFFLGIISPFLIFYFL